jgi:O-antigen/teichoic acid export membrane protein
VGQILATGVLCWYSIREKRFKLNSICLNKMRKLADQYSNFPKINVLHALIDNLNASGIIFMVTFYFGATIVGYYTFMMRILQAPIGLVSSSMTQVFYQRASETYAFGGDLVGLINKMLKRLAILALIPALLLLSVGPQLFGIIFGRKWEVAGMYAQLLTPYMLFYFISAPLTLIPFIVHRQKQSLLFSTVGNLLFFVSIMIGATLFNKIEVGLSIYSIIFIVYFFCYRKWIMMISIRRNIIPVQA